MNNDLNKWLRKEIPGGESFKLGIEGQMGFQVSRGKINHFKQNKLHEQKGHHSLGKVNDLVCERE